MLITLYAWATSQPLPFANIKWMTEHKLDDTFDKLTKDIDIPPCRLEVDVDHPKHLHGDHNEYPLLPDLVKVNGVDKLIPMLTNKSNYIIDHRMLKYALSKGLILK